IDFAGSGDKLKDCVNASAVFRPNGSILKVGETILQPKLADTLEIIGNEGRDGFYQGDVAEDIVSYLKSRGGLHTLDDFTNARGDYVTPISAKYKGYDVYQCPPNGQGVIALMLLKLIERCEKSGEGPLNLERVHREIEACRLTYHQRDAYLADPDQVYVPVEEMLSDKNIDQMYEKINNRKIDPLPDFQMPEHKDTVYISVVDKDRNCCSFINTLFHNFGSGLMAPKSGVMLQCRGGGFSLEPGHPNVIAGGKKPLHTIIPAMVASGGQTVMSFGVMGGAYQAFGQMQFLSRYLGYGYDIQAAMDMPRFFANPVTGEVEFESGIDEKIIEGLKDKGHIFEQDASLVGGSQAIWIDRENNLLIGGSDPRKDGCAIGY
ncbi:MAG: gamma-glutamyltransferase, partial [Kordiimonadaceae bacterium]|nr:gamma-glutamyltransferase [Kordiimonadaceae bacterium]